MLSIRAFLPFSFLPLFLIQHYNTLFFLAPISSRFLLVIPQAQFSFLDNFNLAVGRVSIGDHIGSALFNMLFLPFFFKFIYKGKSYRVRLFKKKAKFTFNLGYAHWTKFWFNKFKFYFKKQQRTIFFSLVYSKVLYIALKILLKKLKSPNFYTLRGVRLRRQIVYKRFRRF